MKKLLLFLSFSSLILISFAQVSRQAWDSISRLSARDHRLMMDMLGITELRPGPSGNPQAPDAANSDESKATTYTSLPDPLVFKNGVPVKSAGDWEKRRAEIMEDFDREMYGRVPEDIPAVTWEITRQSDTLIGSFPVVLKELTGRADNSLYPAIEVKIRMMLVTPAGASSGVPVMVEFGWILPAGWKMPPAEGLSWQEQLLQKGWGYAILIPTSYQPDHGAGLREGIIGLTNKGMPRKPDEWGALRAWAWGASRAMDYFETDKHVDASKVGIEGLSRYGKAALVTMAYDTRFAAGFIGSSGAGGAKILRRTFGEQVENLASSGEYHWFAPNFIKYAGPLTPSDLPVDAHELIALCAPRPVFISSGSPDVEGNWIDARGMFFAAVHAGPVYTLLGRKDMGTPEFPSIGTGLTGGDIAFRQHEGGHTVVPNWPYFIEWADKYFRK